MGKKKWKKRTKLLENEVRNLESRLEYALSHLVVLKKPECRHTHTFSYSLDGAKRIYGDTHGVPSDNRAGLVLEGCYICGEVQVRDYCK